MRAVPTTYLHLFLVCHEEGLVACGCYLDPLCSGNVLGSHEAGGPHVGHYSVGELLVLTVANGHLKAGREVLDCIPQFTDAVHQSASLLGRHGLTRRVYLGGFIVLSSTLVSRVAHRLDVPLVATLASLNGQSFL